MAQIFISYKRANYNQVVKIVKYIESELSEKCWMDIEGIEYRTQFASTICKAIDESKIVLFMYSSMHLNIDYENDWTVKELSYAHAKNKIVVLVKLDDSRLENIFLLNYGSKNNVDSKNSVQLEKLVNDIPVVNGCVNNAGFNVTQPLPFIKEDDAKQIFDVNILAPILLTNQLVKKKKITKIKRVKKN